MRRLFFASVLLSLFPGAASASEPGQPLDCSDWVILEPGLSCGYWFNYPCPSQEYWCRPVGNQSQIDNQGRMFRRGLTPLTEFCPVTMGFMKRHEIWAFDGTVETLIAYVDERCNETYEDRLDFLVNEFLFFEESGKLVLPRSLSDGCNPYNCGPAAGAYDSVEWVPVLEGFATTFEILQSYLPLAVLSFRVPYMPEGLPAADWFDTYTGPLTQPLDFTQAQPLACGYPSSLPNVGDYLTVADPLPNPATGEGRYYVTAVNYQGQRRYGRQRIGGVQSGRSPALLPVCDH